MSREQTVFNPKEIHKIARIKNSSSTELQVRVNEFEDRAMIDCRIWYKKKDSKKFMPSGKGLTIPADSIKELVLALKKARKVYVTSMENIGSEESEEEE